MVIRSVLCPFALAITLSLPLVSPSRAVEEGFIPLLDRDHTDGWQQCGPGEMKIRDGVSTNSTPQKWSVAWYHKRMFTDFVLKAEFKGVGREYNSGIWLRFSEPRNNDPATIHDQKYEVAISRAGKDDRWPTGSFHGLQRPFSDALKPSDWNEYEITVVGQDYTVKLNGVVVNRLRGNRNLSGYIGLEENSFGPVQFRNVRIKDLSGSGPIATQAAPPTMQTNADQPRLETLSQQAPNATAWILAPLDKSVPPDIRQNLTFLLEDLLDEGKGKPAATTNAYQLGSVLCRTMIGALDERTQTQARAGFRAVEANARTGVTSQALEVRRNYKMSWPQYAREESQRAELKGQALNNAEVLKERAKLDWVERSAVLQKSLDRLYAQFRESLRQ
jgi:hypothetical protein